MIPETPFKCFPDQRQNDRGRSITRSFFFDKPPTTYNHETHEKAFAQGWVTVRCTCFSKNTLIPLEIGVCQYFLFQPPRLS